MKYTKKQIKKAFSLWEKDNRLNPTKFDTREQCLEVDAEVQGVNLTETLLTYINK